MPNRQNITLQANMGIEETRVALRDAFPEISKDEFSATAGDREKLVKLVAEKKGISEADAKSQVDEVFAKAG